jgi:hypothetical protein
MCKGSQVSVNLNIFGHTGASLGESPGCGMPILRLGLAHATVHTHLDLEFHEARRYRGCDARMSSKMQNRRLDSALDVCFVPREVEWMVAEEQVSKQSRGSLR